MKVQSSRGDIWDCEVDHFPTERWNRLISRMAELAGRKRCGRPRTGGGRGTNSRRCRGTTQKRWEPKLQPGREATWNVTLSACDTRFSSPGEGTSIPRPRPLSAPPGARGRARRTRGPSERTAVALVRAIYVDANRGRGSARKREGSGQTKVHDRPALMVNVTGQPRRRMRKN